MVDGDTVEITPAIRGVEEVRLIGVDSPETVDPSEEVEPYGPQGSAYTTKELAGQRVDLEFDVERIDQYDRLLAYVYTGDGQIFNESLLEGGYAQAYSYPPNTKCEDRFAAAPPPRKRTPWRRVSGSGAFPSGSNAGSPIGATVWAREQPDVAAPRA